MAESHVPGQASPATTHSWLRLTFHEFLFFIGLSITEIVGSDQLPSKKLAPEISGAHEFMFRGLLYIWKSPSS